MTLLTVCQAVAADVGIPRPNIVMAGTEAEIVELRAFANAVAQEIASRVDWGALTRSVTLTGTGLAEVRTISTACRKICDGRAVFTSTGAAIRPLSFAEWPLTSVVGTPRYFLAQGQTIQFYPHLASGATAVVRFITLNWSTINRDVFVNDTDGTLFPEELLTLGLIAHWRRQKAMPYQDQEAAYEARLAQLAADDDRRRFE